MLTSKQSSFWLDQNPIVDCHGRPPPGAGPRLPWVYSYDRWRWHGLPRNDAMKGFRHKVLSWYRANRHDFPWRNTRDPYKILVSEVMLQQTQVDRVKVKWPEFLRSFPTVKALANAPTADVIRAWKGMGYNRRALYLQKAAQTVMEKHGGKFPQTLQELRALPGVGEYTARALLVFAFGKCLIAPDVNVLRILRRSFSSPLRKGEARRGSMVRRLIAIGDAIVTPKTAYDLNQALMDLGRTTCTAKNPRDGLCPLHSSHISDVTWRRPRVEPMFAGVPRRIWRGRIVELVRAQNKLSQHELLNKLGIQKDPHSIQWLKLVIGQLVKDGVLVLRSRMVAFP